MRRVFLTMFALTLSSSKCILTSLENFAALTAWGKLVTVWWLELFLAACLRQGGLINLLPCTEVTADMYRAVAFIYLPYEINPFHFLSTYFCSWYDNFNHSYFHFSFRDVGMCTQILLQYAWNAFIKHHREKRIQQCWKRKLQVTLWNKLLQTKATFRY